jgi:branched-chain amino acid transport system substrate-binding protein
MRFSDAATAINLDSAKSVVAEFRAENYEPEGYTLSSYAAVQAFAAAAKATGGTDGAKMAEWLHGNTVPSVIGDLTWDAKGDLKKVDYAWFIWHDGKYTQEPLN